MKRITALILGGLLCLTAACSRHKIIPDNELSQIFHDAFLTNAYINSENFRFDSLNIYEPIFARYGYTTSDVQYTIGNFSKRKSARLGDVVERAITQLENEGKYYDSEVAVLDTIDNVARRAFTRVVRSDSLIRVKSLRDTSRLSFTVDVEPGEYRVSFDYRVDSLDRNERGLRSVLWLERQDGTRANVYSSTLRRERDENYSRLFTIDSSYRRLRVVLLNFNDKPQLPAVTVTNFKITYTPPAAQAVEQLYRRQSDVRIFADEFFGAFAPESADTSDTTDSADAPSKDSL